MTGAWLGTPVPGERPPPPGGRSSARLHVDCDQCTVRGPACGECVISVLLGPPGDVDLDTEEQAALAALAGSGLVPPLRLVTAMPPPRRPDPDDLGELEPVDPDRWGDDGWGDGAAQDWV